MTRIQKVLNDHIVVCGYGTSGAEAVRELIARGIDPTRIVVIDGSDSALALAEARGCNVLKGDATRDQTLNDVRVGRASAVIVAAGRDDTSVLITLTARHLAPAAPISVIIRAEDNEDLARQAGATTVINPASFAGLLLAGSCQGTHIADYMADLAAIGGQVKLAERSVKPEEVGKPLHALTSGIGLRIYRDGRPLGHSEGSAAMLAAGDVIVEVVPGNG